MILFTILNHVKRGKVPFFGMKKLNNWRVNPAPLVSKRGAGQGLFHVYSKKLIYSRKSLYDWKSETYSPQENKGKEIWEEGAV